LPKGGNLAASFQDYTPTFLPFKPKNDGYKFVRREYDAGIVD
jgi:hypothetical protein